MKVRQLMTAYPHHVSVGATLRDAVESMLRHEVRQLPVLQDGTVVGMITDRDARRALGSAGGRLTLATLSGEQLADPVSRWMSHGAATFGPDDDVAVACRALATLRVGAMPVVDEDDQVVGILSVTDLLSEAADLFDGISNE